MNILNNTVTKVGVGFAAGAILVGGISNAAPSLTPSSKTCVSTSTNAVYLAKNGACPNGQKLTTINADSIDVAAIAAAAGPSVVSIEERVYNGGGTGSGWIYKVAVNWLSGTVSTVIIVIFAVVKFTEGAWVILVITPILVIALIRLNRQYRLEQAALKISKSSSRATSISRHDVAVLVDAVDIATIGSVRYARSLKPRDLTAVHFVIDDVRAEGIKEAWAANPGLSDVPIEFIDCPDRRIANAAVDYAIRATASEDVELTMLLPRRSYSRFLGRLLHDQTAEEIARPISQLSRVVATIVPFDVEKIITGETQLVHPETFDVAPVQQVNQPKTIRLNDAIANESDEKVHYAKEIIPINKVTWRKRAHVRGTVTSIRNAPSGGAPRVEVEVWDETGGISLQFLGRRQVMGLEVGSTICAEGMVGEEDGALTIFNPSYELLI